MSEVTIRGVALIKEDEHAIVRVEISGKWVEIIRDPWDRLYKHYALAGFISERERNSPDSAL